MDAVTPRTDGQETTGDRMQYYGVVSVVFARMLEKELNEWKIIANKLVESGDPKPWKIEEWNAAKQKCAEGQKP